MQSRLWFGWLALCLWAGAVGCAWAQGAALQRESAVKAAFLYRFAGFVEWPAGALRADEPLTVAVVNNEAVAADLEQIVAGRTIEGRRVLVRRLREGEAAAAHVMFLGATSAARLREAIAAVPGPVLVVSEQDAGLKAGSVLNFQNEEGRVRFTASVAAAEARGLRLSARLLAVAAAVEGRPR